MTILPSEGRRDVSSLRAQDSSLVTVSHCCVLQLQTVGHEHARVIQWSRTRILLDFSNYVGAPKIEMVDK